jgi:hypothetical protein
MTQAYPLQWPAGWPRTPPDRREESKYRFRRTGQGSVFWTFAAARDALMDELDRIGAREAVLSSNYELRLDGLPRGNGPIPEDTGVAVYFSLKGVAKVMACDMHQLAEENMRSIALAIGALRALERHGGGHMMTAAFQGFTALPAPGPGQSAWWQVLGLGRANGCTEDAIRRAHRAAIREAHADRDDDLIKALNIARDQGLKETATAMETDHA